MGDAIVVCFTYADDDTQPLQSDYYYTAKPHNETKQSWGVRDALADQREKLKSYRLCQ